VATDLECAVEDVEYVDAAFRDRRHPDIRLPLDTVRTRVSKPGAPVTGKARFEGDDELSDFSYTAEVADVAVDRETGQVTLKKLTVASDIGTVLNPLTATGQIEGGLMFGVGTALMEEMRLDEGRIETVGFHDYKLPTAGDVPEFDHEFIKGGSDGVGPGPYGAKECSELTSNPVPPAIANAIFDAIGIRPDSLPMTAESIHRALRATADVQERARTEALGQVT
jgi:CO/xanthine dehydrogenase Mo-binding subunit